MSGIFNHRTQKMKHFPWELLAEVNKWISERRMEPFELFSWMGSNMRIRRWIWLLSLLGFAGV